MAIPAIVAIVPIGVLLVLSGLIVNLLQIVFSILVRPVSKSMYRKINKVVAELLWLELIWLIDWWAGIKVELYVDSETFQLMGKEHALLISNHKSNIDWLVGWLVAQAHKALKCPAKQTYEVGPLDFSFQRLFSVILKAQQKKRDQAVCIHL
ncbi:1-acyl-sn-glycerol-3-phosphate acyltransferase 3 [Pyrus ussuriensis x Pyrus communis]|uniref:1-acyl-sn-glycerol-3-phosphate acyltransferase 3 n=1 Tax=Pyrus ussuriensis x Pyrus communis TaxID=2448454 RepID=A0A5N5G6D3_9ROSA|nr:1-acyl-sn-glycerol-3-phosphate acyltransferase 3 [Pyrus ussuriensis x Pyrus communis]